MEEDSLIIQYGSIWICKAYFKEEDTLLTFDHKQVLCLNLIWYLYG